MGEMAELLKQQHLQESFRVVLLSEQTVLWLKEYTHPLNILVDNTSL